MADRDDPIIRGKSGQFAAGHSGNPRGRVAGSRNKATLAIQAILEEEAEALARKAIELALAGNIAALRLCFSWIAPPHRERPAEFDMPPVETVEDAEKAGAAVIEAVAAGEITTRESLPVMALLAAQKKLIETGDLARRVAAIKTQLREQGAAPHPPSRWAAHFGEGR